MNHSIDTSRPYGDDRDLPVVCGNRSTPPSRLQARRTAASDLEPVAEHVQQSQSLEPLLDHLDGVFQRIMDASLTSSAAAGSAPDTDSRREKPDSMPPGTSLPDGPSAQDLIERDRFCNTLNQTPVLVTTAPFGAMSRAPGAPLIIRRGLGPPVFIGFDAEWQQVAKGKNRLLSVQFYVIGPTGLRHTQVLEFRGAAAVDVRPSLVEALTDLLEEAEEACVFDEWPCEVVLCGHFVRADLPVFRDFKQFRHQLKALNGTLATVGTGVQMQLGLSEEQTARLKHRYSYVVGDGYDPRMLSVRIIDSSRLFAPGTSVEQLGDWLEYPKLLLPKGQRKSDMARFQREFPVLFREYGLRDAEIAVLAVLWVVWFCDRYLGMKNHRHVPVTASNLSVQLSKMCMAKDGVHPDVALNIERVKQMRWNEAGGRPVTVSKKVATRIRGWLEPFMADAYMGGRNECYWFGPTPLARHGKPVKLHDHDLAAAYVMCLVWLMALDYDRLELVRDAEQFRGMVNGIGFAEVDFEFPPETTYPCLPVATKYGLWFPRKGVSLATAAEIELALMMGATIHKVRFGVLVPFMARSEVMSRSEAALRKSRKAASRKSKAALGAAHGITLMANGETSDEGEAVFEPVQNMQFPPESHGDIGYRLFESFAIYTRHMRLKFRRKTMPHEFMKLVGNGAYGKTGQGHKQKKGLDLRDMKLKPIGHSAISEAAIAATVSGSARAVLGEILWKLPKDALAVSVTTDGLLVDVEKLDLSGVMCQRFQALVDRVAPGTGMTELKHLITQAVAGKTRLQLTGQVAVDAAGKAQAPVVAKGGIKVPLSMAQDDEAKERWLKSAEGQNLYVLNLFINRYPGQIIPRPSLMGLKEMLVNGWDLQTLDDEVRLNMEYDFKRRPVNPSMLNIVSHGVSHLAFETEPWETVEEGEMARTLFDRWRTGNPKAASPQPGNCLKTMRDWESWQGFYQHYAGNRRRTRAYQALDNPERSGSPGSLPSTGSGTGLVGKVTRGVTGMRYLKANDHLGVAIRTFLAAYVQRAWGLAEVDLSQAKLTQWLTSQGYAVKLHDVKNAGRTQLHEHSVVSTPEVMAFFEVVKARFLGLEVDRFIQSV